MGALVKIFGIILMIGSTYQLFLLFQTQILSQTIQSQTPDNIFGDFFDFFVQTATPEITSGDIAFGIFYGILFIVGLAMLIRK
jgi:hypothetical protein